MIAIEICANSLTSAIAAHTGGAARIELCDNLREGGTTPSYGQIAVTRDRLSIPLYPIIRPRGGDFLYADEEFDTMVRDLEQCRSLGCDGVVFGLLTETGDIDVPRCAELKQLAGPLGTTFHRAFDRCRDPFAALEAIIALGFDRILTSGLEESAIHGAPLLAQLVERAAGRISIMPGAGVNPQNLAALIRITGASEYHTTAKARVNGGMAFRAPAFRSQPEEYAREQTDPEIVRQLVEIARTAEVRKSPEKNYR